VHTLGAVTLVSGSTGVAAVNGRGRGKRGIFPREGLVVGVEDEGALGRAR